MERGLPVELFEFAINLSAQVQPMHRGWQAVARHAVQQFPTKLEHNPVDHYTFVLKFRLIYRRQRYNMNIMPEVGEYP